MDHEVRRRIRAVARLPATSGQPFLLESAMNVLASTKKSTKKSTKNPSLLRVRPLVRIVIVGHVDHGKSTLIGRLLHETKQFA